VQFNYQECFEMFRIIALCRAHFSTESRFSTDFRVRSTGAVDDAARKATSGDPAPTTPP
jgi:hypothetical protein